MKSNIKLIFRNLSRKSSTTIINMLGLSLSLTLVLILSAYSVSEFSTDKFHEKGKNIYFVQQGEQWPNTPAILKTSVDANISGIKNSVRIKGNWRPAVFQINNEEPIESDMIFSDNGFFKLFDYKEEEGNLETALDARMSVVISKKLAGRLFGNEPAVGKTVKMDNKFLLTITGVFKEQVSNTVFSFNSICNIESMQSILYPSPEEFTNWGWNNYQTFLLLDEKTDPSFTADQIIKLFPEDRRERVNELQLIPFPDVYFTSFSVYIPYLKTGNRLQVSILCLVALLVLMIALVNFLNITTAHWQKRIKQTGILKVIGAKRNIIIGNMFFEILLLFVVSFILAYFIVSAIMPVLARETTIQFNRHLIFSPLFIFSTIISVVLLSFICCIIPSTRIASSEILVNLKKKIVISKKKTYLKGMLVSIQFSVTIVLILFTILVQKQVRFGTSNLGINQENIIGMELTDELSGKKEVLKESLLAQSDIEEVIFTEYYPGDIEEGWAAQLQIKGEKEQMEFRTFSADAGFFNTLGLKLLKGRLYDENLESDKHKVIVNEQFLLQYGPDPVGGIITPGNQIDYEIIGVVKDFHFRPVNEPIAPLVIRNDNKAGFALIKIKTANFKAMKSSLEEIENIASEISPLFPVKVSFYNEAVESMYQSETKFRKVFTLFSVCAIIISCMGILAMSLFASNDRIKEIGIRKVNGAKVSEILALLNKDFVLWVVIALIIATPIAYYTMNKWLENFAYKTEISWWIFAATGGMILMVALLTVSWQSWRAATRNPVEALRYE